MLVFIFILTNKYLFNKKIDYCEKHINLYYYYNSIMPYKDQRREFKKFRYIITNDDMPKFQAFCQSWQEVKEASGIPRSGLYLILKGEHPPKHIKWNIVRTTLERSHLLVGAS